MMTLSLDHYIVDISRQVVDIGTMLESIQLNVECLFLFQVEGPYQRSVLLILCS